MSQIAREFLRRSIAVKQSILDDSQFLDATESIGQKLIQCVESGGTIYICGNGGSACDAIHFAEELVARYKRERRGIRAMHFGDPGVLTCWSNDYEYESAFARQAETFCTNKDILVGISTSGNSSNVLKAVEVAKTKGAYTIGLSGKDGGKLIGAVDTCLVVPSDETDRIQESHITLIHIFCEMIETSKGFQS